MRLDWPPPMHLIASALISLLALALVNLSPESVREGASLLALGLVILIPGYLIVLYLFPTKRDLDSSKRIILSLVLSALLAGLISLVLMQTPRGLQPASLATILALLAVFLVAISYIRVSMQPRKRGSASRPRRGHRSPGILSSIPGASVLGRSRGKAPLLAIVAVLFVAAIAFAVSLNHASSSEGATSLEVFWPGAALNSQSAPLELGRELEVIAKIINHEKSSTNYTLKLKLNNSTLFTKDLNLDLNETWRGRLGFALIGSQGLQGLDLQLFKEGDFSTPYREEHLDVNLFEDTSPNASQNESQDADQNNTNSAGINTTDNSSPVILEEKSKVTVLSAGGASSVSTPVSATSTQSAQSPQSSQISQSAVQSQSTAQSATVSSSTASSASVSEPVVTKPVAIKPVAKTVAAAENTTVAKNTTTAGQSAEIEAQNPGLLKNNSTPSTNAASFFTASVSPEKSTPPNAPSSPKTSPSTSFFAQSETTPEPTTSPELSKSPESTKPLDSALSIASTKQVSEKNNLSDQSRVDSSVGSIDKPQENLIPNLPPKLAGLNANKTNPVLGSIVQWTANASDPDSDRIYYKFLADDEEVNDWSQSDTWIWNTAAAKPGDHKITVLARDGKHSALDSFDDSMNASITLTSPNQPPVLKSLQPDKPSPQEKGTTIFWKATALDPDNDKILYRFLTNGHEARKWSKSNSWSWPTGNLPAGDYQITAQARDSLHASEDSFDSTMDATMVISDPNHTPVLNELKASTDSPQAQGAVITWTASASDPEGDQVLYKFLANDKEMTDWLPSNSWSWDTTGAMPADYEIRVQARDGLHAGAASSDSELARTFAITSSDQIPNQIPLVQELKPDMISPQAQGAAITWTAIAADPEGDKIYYKFLADDKEMTGWSPSNTWSWNTSAAASADYKITVLARDGLHADEGSFDSSRDAAFTLQASNQPPILKSLKPDSSSPQVQGAAVLWKAGAQDPDGDPVLYKFQVNGRDMNRWSESDSWKWSTKDLPAGGYKIRVLARDGRHAAEDSFDSTLDTAFTLTTEIDQQIDLLMNQRVAKSSAEKDYHSSDIRVTVANDTDSKAILGKSNGDVDKENTGTPRKLG